jgi:hypothetical protein
MKPTTNAVATALAALVVATGLVGAAVVVPSPAAAVDPPAPTASPSVTPSPPRWFTAGWMIEPPVPGFAYAHDVDPPRAPGTWTVLARDGSGNSAGHPNAVVKDAVGRYLVWLPGIRSGGVAEVSNRPDTGARCWLTGQVDSPEPYHGTDLTVACAAATGEPVDTAFSVRYSAVG